MTRNAGKETFDWRKALRYSRIYVCLWSAAQARHYTTLQQRFAYAQQLRKPVRILRMDTTPLPEDLCVGYADVQVARCATSAQGAAQVDQWLEEVLARED